MVAELAVLIAVRVRAQVLLPEQLQGHSLAPQLLDHHRKSLGQPLIARARPRHATALQHGQQLAVGQLLRLLPGQSAAAEALQVLRHRGARHLQRAANRSLTEFGGHPVADDLFDFVHAGPPACHASPSCTDWESVVEDRTKPRPGAASNWLFSPGRVAFYFRTAGFLKTDQWLFCTGFCTQMTISGRPDVRQLRPSLPRTVPRSLGPRNYQLFSPIRLSL